MIDDWLFYVVTTGVGIQLALNAWVMRTLFLHNRSIATLKTMAEHSVKADERIEATVDATYKGVNDLTVAMAEVKLQLEGQDR